MKRIAIAALLAVLTLTAKAHNPTWTDGIACIIYSHCTSCHNENGIAPFSLTTYNDVYQNRYSIVASVQAGSMPPFPPDQSFNALAHANVLTEHEIDELVDWVNNFAPLGDANNIPNPPTYTSSAEITNPDVLLQIPTYTVNTSNDLYRVFVLPANNANQEYIQSIEVIPGNRDIVHHALVFQDTSSIPLNLDLADPQPGYTAFGSTGSPYSELIWGYTPGQGKFTYAPGFGARLLPNSNICIQIHYPGGIFNELDSTQIRIKYGSSTLRNVLTAPVLNHGTSLTNGPLAILPDSDTVFYSQYNVVGNYTLTGIMPHMHLLGKSIKSYFVKPTGDTVRLIDIPEWDFHWQGFYQFQKPVIIPNGSVLYGEARYDNTVNNPNNPNYPPLAVTAGEGTTDEMMLIYFNVSAAYPTDGLIIIDTSSHKGHYLNCVNTIGLNEVSAVHLPTSYPNPSNATFYIDFASEEFDLDIINVEGAVVKTYRGCNAQSRFKIETSGTYYLRIQSKGETRYLKQIINP